MKKSDLYREWARVLDMCEGTNVRPEDCWSLNNRKYNERPEFDADPEYFKFAIAILEDKPVFVGDKLYICSDPYPVYANINGGASNDHNHYPFQMCSWNTPKNDEVIPKHCGISANGYADIDGTYKLNVSNWTFHYSTSADRDKALAAIKELLK